MYCTIVRDIPGRLRLRCGRYMFDEVEARGITEMLLVQEGVTLAQVTSSNGGILVIYEGRRRDEIFRQVLDMDPRAFPRAAHPGMLAKGEAENRMQVSLITRVGAYLLRKLLLPFPLCHLWTLFRAMHYIGTGFSELYRHGLVVEVLDAIAIVAALSRGRFDAAGSIMLLLGVSETLEGYVRQRSRAALQDSLMLRVGEVWRVEGSEDVLIPMDEVEVGDRVRVRTGSLVPVDGKVSDGEGAVNESSMTGESRLVHKYPGLAVFAGSVLDEGALVIEVLALADDSRIAEIVSMIDRSEHLKSEAQGQAEHMADAIVPFNLVAFLLVLALTRNGMKAASVLMVDYSCAMKLSIPIAVMSAMREAANRGSVVKGGRFFEELAAADVFVFDKTGTLTDAQPAVERVISWDERISESEALRLAACLEEHFPHSVARAIVNEARERGLVHAEEHAEVDYIVAHGIRSELDGGKVCIGSAHFVFEDEGVPCPPGMSTRIEEMAPGCSDIFLAADGVLIATVCISDPPRDSAPDVIAALHAQGVERVIMLTGDADAAARVTARRLDIDGYRSQVLPQDKARIVEELRAEGHRVAMVGDGVNDSPGLAAANVAIAMGDATDIAQEVADIVIMGGSLEMLPMVQTLAKRLTVRIEKSYRRIVVFNTALMLLGVVGAITPTAGALLHNISTICFSILNTTPLLPACDSVSVEVLESQAPPLSSVDGKGMDG